MSAYRPSRGFNFGLDKQLLATDSVVLHERDVTAAINAVEADSKQGDVLDGLRYGMLFSAVLWAAILLSGFLLFL
jgi:hypothetical protein